MGKHNHSVPSTPIISRKIADAPQKMKKACFHRSLTTSGCVPSLSVNNTRARPPSTEATNIVGGSGERR
jgi:hypothetical protein